MALLTSGATFAVGSLPHRDAAAAAEFAWSATDIPTLPTLPRRSPAEGMLAQVMVGLGGVTVGQYGGINISTVEVSSSAGIDLDSDSFVGYREFLSLASRAAGDGHPVGLVKLQCVGPVTLGLSLAQTGIDVGDAFALALEAVRDHVRSVQNIVHRELPSAAQLVVVDEPSLRTALADPRIDREQAVDAVSGVLAAVRATDLTGVHSCGAIDWPAMFDVGAGVLSVPVPRRSALDDLVRSSRRLAEHLDLGGWIAWGVVRTDGPIPLSAERPWKSLSAAWSALAAVGIDRDLLASRTLLTPVCGLGTHSEGVATRVMSILREVSRRLSGRVSPPVVSGGS